MGHSSCGYMRLNTRCRIPRLISLRNSIVECFDFMLWTVLVQLCSSPSCFLFTTFRRVFLFQLHRLHDHCMWQRNHFLSVYRYIEWRVKTWWQQTRVRHYHHLSCFIAYKQTIHVHPTICRTVWTNKIANVGLERMLTTLVVAIGLSKKVIFASKVSNENNNKEFKSLFCL